MNQLAYARTRAGAKMADFRVGNAEDLPFAAGSFDVAAMALVMAFLPDPGKAIAEMTRVARPGGMAAAYMWDVPGGGVPVHSIYLALESMGLMSGRPSNAAASERHAMQRFWKGAGLEAIETRVISIPTVYSNFDEFWNANAVPIGPQGKTIASMSESAREELRSRVRDLLPVSSDGRITYRAFANCIKGQVPG